MAEVDFGSVSEIKENELVVKRFGRKRVIVSKYEDNYYAFADICTHDNGPISEGTLCGKAVECPRHGAQFDITTGAVLAPPAITPIKTYPLRVEGDTIKVDLE